MKYLSNFSWMISLESFSFAWMLVHMSNITNQNYVKYTNKKLYFLSYNCCGRGKDSEIIDRERSRNPPKNMKAKFLYSLLGGDISKKDVRSAID